MQEPIEAEANSTAITHRPDASLALSQGTPKEIVERATEMADVLQRVIRDKGLFANIRGREHVNVEGWTTLGAIVGVFPQIEWSRPIKDEGKTLGWEARCIVATPKGDVIGAGEAECMKAERNWGDRDDYALRSMAQTRAVSKAMRLPLSWVITLAGFDATPAEEMPQEPRQKRAQKPPERQEPPQTDPQARERELGKLRFEAGKAFDKIVAEMGQEDANKYAAELGAQVMENGHLNLGQLTEEAAKAIIG